MRRLLCILALAAGLCHSAASQTIPSKQAQRTVADSLSARLKRRDSVETKLKISKVYQRGSSVDIRFSSSLGDHPWHEEDQKWFIAELKKEWGKLGGPAIGNISCGNIPFKELVSPKLTFGGGPVYYEHTDNDRDCRTPSGRFIRRVGARHFDKGLSDRHIALWQSHGRYYKEADSLWSWQRATMFRTVEDMYTQSYVLPFLIPMLENAGAYVLTPRERDIQSFESVVDNDPSFKERREGMMRSGGKYSEIGEWIDAGVGFADSKPCYSIDDNPFTTGTVREIRCNSSGSATIKWTPEIKSRGEYAVYISYKSLPASSSEAHYTVHHLGGDTEFTVNQKIGGGTWIYLGTFEFDKGFDAYVCLDNRGEASEVVTADAVRFGGGMGKLERFGTTSGLPSYMEGALYWMKWAGIDNSLFDVEWENDYKKDYATRGAWTRMMKEEKGVPFDLSLAFHTDAGTNPADTTIGTLAIYTLFCDDERKYPDGRDRMIARTYADFVQSQVVEDIRDEFNPDWTRRKLWDKSYSECRTTGVPGMILELLSHQNFEDMKYGLDPSFKFTVCRAVYKGILKTLSEFYGCPYEVQPLPVSSFAVSFAENGAKAHLSWKATQDKKEPTASPKGYIIYTRVDDGVFDSGKEVSGESADLDIEPGHIYSYKVVAFNDGGKSFPSETLAIGKSSGRKNTVLIVNNFNRVSGPDYFDTPDFAGFLPNEDSGVPYIKDISYIGEMYQFDRHKEYVDDNDPGFGASYTNNAGEIIAGNTFDWPYVHGKIFFELGYSFCSSSSEAFCEAPDTTAELLDLICGKQKTVKTGPGHEKYQVFPASLQKAVRSFAAAGGNLFVTGSKIASDAEHRSDAQMFIREILGIKLVNSHGTGGGIVGDYEFSCKPNADIYSCETVDAIAPAGKSGRVFLRYPMNNCPAGTVFSTEQYSAVCIAVPLETIKSESDRKALVKKSLQELQRR